MRAWGPKRRESRPVFWAEGRTCDAPKEGSTCAQGKQVKEQGGGGGREKNGSCCKEWARRLGELLELRTQGRQRRSRGAWEAIPRPGFGQRAMGVTERIRQGVRWPNPSFYIWTRPILWLYILYIYTNFTRLLPSQWLLVRVSMPTWVVKQFLLETKKKL